MNRRVAVALLIATMFALGACEKRAAPNTKSPTPPAPALSAVAPAKDLTNEAFLIWLDLVTVWHREHKPDRLQRVAKVSGWGELTPELLDVVGAKRGYGYRVGDTTILIGGDDEGGSYGVVVTATLDSESVIRQLAQAFDIRQCGDMSEAGMKTQMFSLIAGGAPVGIAAVDTSTVESSPVTRIGFVSMDRMKQAGLKLPPDLATLSDLIEKALAGETVSQVRLGDAYFAGKFGKANPALAVDYWRMAVKQESASGCQRLALAYYLGTGVEKSLEIASDLFEKAATGGDAEGQAMTGWMYATGDGKVRDPATAADWLQRAVEQGHAGAANNLAGLYEKGEGVQRDQRRSLALYRESAAKGYGLAHANLGRAYAFGRGVPVNKAEAAKCFQAAADLGATEGVYGLGVLFQNGEGVTRDLVKAADLFERAAKKGHAGAQNNLGLMLAKGEGRTRDLIESAKWSIIASSAGNADAIANMPQLNSYLTPMDLREAERRAAAFEPELSAADDILSGVIKK